MSSVKKETAEQHFNFPTKKVVPKCKLLEYFWFFRKVPKSKYTVFIRLFYQILTKRCGGRPGACRGGSERGDSPGHPKNEITEIKLYENAATIDASSYCKANNTHSTHLMETCLRGHANLCDPRDEPLPSSSYGRTSYPLTPFAGWLILAKLFLICGLPFSKYLLILSRERERCARVDGRVWQQHIVEK